jgi:DNA-binding NarL/FixJ family response regulator
MDGARGSSEASSNPTAGRPLSGRERQVFELIGLGRTSKEVAFQLGIAPATVRVLQARARKKLCCPDASAAAPTGHADS